MELKPGYKMTEVGVIPEDWESRPLSSIGRFKNGINKGSEAFGHGSAFVNLMDVFGVNSIKSCDGLGLVKTSDAEQKAYDLKRGDVIFIRSSVKPSGVGLTAVVEEDLPNTVYSGFLLRFRDENVLDIAFKKHCFYLEKFRSNLIAASTVSANTNINQDNLKKLFVAIPPTQAEQRAIAQALSDVDALLAALDRLIAKKQAIKQATMQSLLTGKKRLPGFSGAWDFKPFAAVLNRLNAKSYQIQASEYQEIGRFPVVDQGKNFVVGFSDRADKRFICPDGGVIVFGDHTCIVKFVNFDFLVGADGTQILQGKHGQNTQFHALQLQYRGIETTGYNRHFKILKELEFFIPSLAEQTAITAVLSDMDAELSALKTRRDKTRQLKHAMMQELLTGKTRLI